MGCCISQRHNEKEDKIENINRQIIINSADLYKETCWKRYSGLHNHDVDQNFDNHSINTKQTSNLDTDTQRIKISIELISFELTYSHYYAKFHQEFEPYFVICHSDTYRVFSEFIKDKKGNFEVNNNSDDESTYTLEDTRTTHKFDDLEYFKKSSTVYISKKLGKFQDKNIFSIEIFPDLNWNNYVSIKLLNHSELDNKLFLIGECKLPIIFLYGRFKKDDWQSYASISIRNSCHNIELGQLNFQIITKHYDKQIKKLGINKDNCMLKLKEFSKLHLLRLEDIPLNVIKQNFVTEDRLLDYGRLKREFSYLIDKITDTINFSKIDDLRQMITRKQFKKVPYDTIRVDHVNYYALMYTINTILDNYNSDKKSLHLFERLTNEFFSHNFIFQYLVEDSGSSNLLLTINFLQIIVNLHKYKLMKSSYLVFSTVNYLIKNFGDIYSSTKCLLPNIINRNRLLAVDDNLKIFIVSDFDYLNIKDFYYNFLSGIRYTYEYYIHLLTNEKSSIDSTTKDFLLQDIITFKQNYKLYFLFTDKFLILDDNIVLSIINIFYCYIKFARLFAQIYNISKLELIQETLLADFKFTNWLYTIFNQYNTEANFNISFLEITYELLKDAGGIFIFNFLKIFDLGFFMINFRNYMISFNKSNYLLWYYQILNSLMMMTINIMISFH